MSLDVIARVGPLTFRSRELTAGADGFYIDDEGFEGWNDGADVLRDAVNRPLAHGAFDAPGFLDARVVSISGTCWASSPEMLTDLGNQLTGLLAEGSGRITVEQPGSLQWATGRLGALTTFSVRPEDIRSAYYQLQLWCADPRKFGEAQTFPNADYTLAQVHHRGNFPALPIFTVTGSMPSGYTINGPAGRQFKVSAAVTAGHPHVIDMATGELQIDGVLVFGSVTRADTWTVPGGVQVAHTLTPTSGSGTLSVLALSTYI